jgi:alkylation response protein AidB-like acyl-CoA dehydrogenase
MTAHADRQRWVAVAEKLADTLREDVLERDRSGADPLPQLDLLRDSGLTTLLVPAEFGGQGATWSTAVAVIRTLARTDASVAQVLAYHYVNESNAGFAATGEVGERWYRASAANRWVWGDSVNPTDPDLAFTPSGDGWVLSGTKRFSTGASAGDVVLVSGTVRGGDDDGRNLTVVLERARAGVSPLGDWDALGQRQSASGSVRFDDVIVASGDVIAWGSDEPFASLFTPAIQLSFGNLYLGIAQGALGQGVELVRERRGSFRRPIPGRPVHSAHRRRSRREDRGRRGPRGPRGRRVRCRRRARARRDRGGSRPHRRRDRAPEDRQQRNGARHGAPHLRGHRLQLCEGLDRTRPALAQHPHALTA